MFGIEFYTKKSTSTYVYPPSWSWARWHERLIWLKYCNVLKRQIAFTLGLNVDKNIYRVAYKSLDQFASKKKNRGHNLQKEEEKEIQYFCVQNSVQLTYLTFENFGAGCAMYSRACIKG